MTDQPDLLGQMTAWLAATTATLGSQGAASWIAGGAGGFVRWSVTGRKGVRLLHWFASGAAQIFGGAITAHFGWPVALRMIEAVTGDLGEPGLDPQSIATGSFVAGVVGISAVRILVAWVETKGTGALSGNANGGNTDE